MNTDNDLELFLSGRLATSEIDDFLSRARQNPDIIRQLESETGFEAQAYSLAWWTSDRSACFKSVTPQDIFSKPEWARLIECCLNRSTAYSEQVQANRKILRFPRPLRYLAAACIIGAFAASTFFMHRFIIRAPQSQLVSIGQVHPDQSDTLVASAPTSTFTSKTISFDSLVIYSSAETLKAAVTSRPNNGIVRIGEKTAVMIDKNASVEVTTQSDSVIAMTLSSGSALFSVEKNRFQKFTVQTPLSTVSVTGTVFRVSVDDNATVVSVLEGSVLAKGHNDSILTVVFGGMSARITAAGSTLIPGDTAATMPHRPNLLRDFLMENGVWENGTFVRTGIRSDATALNKRFHALRKTILSKAPGIDSVTLAFAHAYPNSSMTGELLLDLSAMHLYRGDTIAGLALLDSTLALSDNDHVAEAFYRSAQLHLDSRGDLSSARHLILRYLSRFPYDPRSFKLLEKLSDELWKKQEGAEAQALLQQVILLTAPNIRLEAILFHHANRLQTAGEFTQALDWYLHLADHYPGGTFRARSLDNATQCIAQSGLRRHENYSHRINDFLHPDGLKR